MCDAHCFLRRYAREAAEQEYSQRLAFLNSVPLLNILTREQKVTISEALSEQVFEGTSRGDVRCGGIALLLINFTSLWQHNNLESEVHRSQRVAREKVIDDLGKVWGGVGRCKIQFCADKRDWSLYKNR